MSSFSWSRKAPAFRARELSSIPIHQYTQACYRAAMLRCCDAADTQSAQNLWRRLQACCHAADTQSGDNYKHAAMVLNISLRPAPPIHRTLHSRVSVTSDKKTCLFLDGAFRNLSQSSYVGYSCYRIVLPLLSLTLSVEVRCRASKGNGRQEKV